jgi:branched-chain amino acid aminotransferase
VLVEPSEKQLVWFDGVFVPWHEARIHVSAHHYGFGVFEGVRAYATDGGAAIFRLADHTARLLRSARIMNMRLPDWADARRLDEAQREILRKNSLRDAYLRPFIFYSGTTGLSPHTRSLTTHVAVMALEWKGGGAYMDGDARSRGIALRTSSFRRSSAGGALTKAKANGNYMTGILALQEAQAAGADEALLLDDAGLVTETSGANVFTVRDGTVCTPPLASVLEGITRDTVLKLASSRGWTVAEKPMTREDVYVADEAFVTGTAAEVTPVRELDGRKIGGGARGRVTAVLQEAYAAHVRGAGEHRPEWLVRI